MKFLKQLIIILLLVSIMSTSAFGLINVTFGDQGDNVIFNTNGSLVIDADLTVLIYDVASGGIPFYNETFTSAITNGSWNVMLGENTNLPMNYLYTYYKDYEIDGEDIDFIYNNGSLLERRSFMAPLGEIQGLSINETLIQDNWNLTGSYLYPANLSYRVGIGTDSPEDTLDIAGHIILTGGDRYIYTYTSGASGYDLTISGGWGGCFKENTNVKTPTGFTAIKDLQIGDILVSYDIVTQTSTTAQVLNITSRIAPSHYIINGLIRVTGEHPLHTDRGQVLVKDLTTSDMLFNGASWVNVDSIGRSSAPITVYNLAVDSPHTFIAGGILAYNKDTTPRPGGDVFVIGGSGSYGATDGDTHLGYDGYSADGYVIISNAYYLPKLDGTIGQALVTDGAGTVSWGTGGFWSKTGTAMYPTTNGDYIGLSGVDMEYITFDYPTDNVWMWYDSANTNFEIGAGGTGYTIEIISDAGISLDGGSGRIVIDNAPLDLNSLPIYGAGSSAQQLIWNGTSNQWEFNQNVYAPHFIGDGSQLTNLSVSTHWNRSGTTIYPTVANDNIGLFGDSYINFYVDGIPKTLKYDTTNNRFSFSDNVNIGQLLTGLKGLLFSPTASAPSTNNGTIYYHSGDNKFYFMQNGIWEELVKTDWSVPVDSDILPNATDTWTIGNSSLLFNSIFSTLGYFTNLHLDNDNGITWGGNKTLIYDATTDNRFEFNDSIYTSSSMDATNYLVSGVEIIDTSRNIADAEIGPHTIGTRVYTNFEGLTADIGDSANYTEFQSDGTQIMYGTARVKKILAYYPYDIGGISGTYNGVACAASGLGSLNGIYFKTYDKIAEEASNMMFVLPPDYVDGTDIDIFFCWLTAGVAGNVTWQTGLTALSDGDLYTQAYTWGTPQTITVPTTAWERDTATFTISGTGITKGDAVSVIVFRDTLNNDDYDGDAYTCNMGIKYTSDRLGE